MQRSTVVKNLRLLRKWSEAQVNATDGAADKAVDIVCGIFDLLEEFPTSLVDINAWLDRPIFGREAPRKHLDDIRLTYHREQGRKALCGLLSLVIEVLEAATFIDDIPVGCLPVKVSVADRGGIGRQKCYPLSVSRKVVGTATKPFQGESHQVSVPTTFDSENHGVPTTDFDMVSDSLESRTKVCRVCQESKPETAFYGHPKTVDRLANECKCCNKSRVTAKRGQA